MVIKLENFQWSWKSSWKLEKELEPLEDVDGHSRKNKAVSETVLFSKLNMVPMQNWVTVICQPKRAQFNNFAFSDNIE